MRWKTTQQYFLKGRISNQSNHALQNNNSPKFRARVRLNQYDVILTKEKSVLRKIIASLGENMQTEYIVLAYRINLYFQDYKGGREIEENVHDNINIDYEIKRQSYRTKTWLWELIQRITTLMFIKLSMKCSDT